MYSFSKPIFFFFFFCFCKAYALYQGNPSSSSMPPLGFFISEESPFGLKVGYQKDHVFKKQMEEKSSKLDLALNSDQATVIINWVDRLEFVSTIGSQTLHFKEEFSKNKKEHSLVWSVGGRSSLIIWNETTFGIAATYLFSYPHVERKKTKYQEWQILLALCQKVDFFSFYLGGAFSSAQLEQKGFFAYKNRHPFSMVLGTSFFTKKGFLATGELRFFGEIALGFDFEFRF